MRSGQVVEYAEWRSGTFRSKPWHHQFDPFEDGQYLTVSMFRNLSSTHSTSGNSRSLDTEVVI